MAYLGNRNNGDGCDEDCKLERMYICQGGDFETPDAWDEWTDGTSPAYDKPEWTPNWYDGRKHESEEWDILKLSSDQGWYFWEIQDGWVWDGGNHTSIDTWTKCIDGLSPNKEKTYAQPTEEMV